ncbi:MAG: cell division protein FtsA [Bacteroidia bacterium]|nr:cell division protein FtsA [Bacteroidia bacterium]
MRDIWGVIDIGTRQVRVLIGQPDVHGRVSVLGAGIAPAEGIDDRGVANIERMASSINKAIQQATQQSGAILQRVWVGLSHSDLRGESTQAIITFPQEDHEITLEDLERLRLQAVQRPLPPDMELIHAIPQTYHLDSRQDVRDPVGMSGIRLEGQFYLVYAPQTHLNMLRRCFQRLKLEVEGFVSRAIIAAEALLSPELKSSGVGFLYLGAHSTAVVLYADGILRHFSVLPLGGHLVTMDIREALRVIMPTQAEALKIQEGVARSSQVSEEEILRLRLPGQPGPLDVRKRFLAQVIEARLEEILLFVAKEIEKAQLLRRLYGGVYLAGGGALMRDIESLVEYVLGERAVRVDIRPLLGRGLIEGVNTPQMAGAVALLHTVPMLREFLPPLPPSASGKKRKDAFPAPSSKPSGKLLSKLRSILENNLKISQDLID